MSSQTQHGQAVDTNIANPQTQDQPDEGVNPPSDGPHTEAAHESRGVQQEAQQDS